MSKQFIWMCWSVIACIVVIPATIHANSWAKAYGGISDEDVGGALLTSDGGYIISGRTLSFGVGSYDILIIKTDSLGNVIWAKTLGTDQYELPAAIFPQLDGGYITGGCVDSIQYGYRDAVVFKLDSVGNLIWAKTYHIANDHFGLAIQTHDRDYIISGHSWGVEIAGGGWDCVIIKVDSLGNMRWAKAWGTPWGNRESLWGILQTTDRGFITVGRVHPETPIIHDIWVAKLDSLGNIMWIKTYGGASDDVGCGILQTQSGEYIVTGVTNSYGAGGFDALVFKLNSFGDIVWARTFGGPLDDGAGPICATSDGCFIMAGTTASYGAGATDVWFIKLTSNGDLVWAKTFGETGGEYVAHITLSSDSGYIVNGSTASWGAGSGDCLLFKLESDGSIAGNCPPLQPCSPGVSVPSLLVNTPTPSDASPTVTVANYIPIVTSPTLLETEICAPVGVEEMGSKNTPDFVYLSQSCPNPFISSTAIEYGLHKDANVEISVYNLSGQIVVTLVDERKKAGFYTVRWDGADDNGQKVASGIYFYRLEAGEFKATKKLTVLK